MQSLSKCFKVMTHPAPLREKEKERVKYNLNVLSFEKLRYENFGSEKCY